MQYLEAKDPDEILDYEIDWAAELESGESISTSTWTVPDGITEDSSTNSTTTTTIVLSGGTAGEEYIITNKVVTDSSPARTHEKTMIVPVLQD